MSHNAPAAVGAESLNESAKCGSCCCNGNCGGCGGPCAKNVCIKASTFCPPPCGPNFGGYGGYYGVPFGLGELASYAECGWDSNGWNGWRGRWGNGQGCCSKHDCAFGVGGCGCGGACGKFGWNHCRNTCDLDATCVGVDNCCDRCYWADRCRLHNCDCCGHASGGEWGNGVDCGCVRSLCFPACDNACCPKGQNCGPAGSGSRGFGRDGKPCLPRVCNPLSGNYLSPNRANAYQCRNQLGPLTCDNVFSGAAQANVPCSSISDGVVLNTLAGIIGDVASAAGFCKESDGGARRRQGCCGGCNSGCHGPFSDGIGGNRGPICAAVRGAREFAESFSVDGLLGRRVDCGCAPRVPVGPCPPAPCAPPTPQPYCEEDCICSPWLKCWKQRYNTCKCYVPVCDHRRCADEHSCGENACGTCVPDNSVCSLLTEGVVCALIKLLFSNEDSPAINYEALLCFTEWLSNNGYCNSADTARGRVDAFVEMLSHVLPDNSSLCLLEDIGLIDFLLDNAQDQIAASFSRGLGDVFRQSINVATKMGKIAPSK